VVEWFEVVRPFETTKEPGNVRDETVVQSRENECNRESYEI
jgi:hypothetical protein